MLVFLMSAGFTLTHLEACTPSYKQTSQLCFTAGFTKDQQDAHHLQMPLFSFPLARLKLYVVNLLLALVIVLFIFFLLTFKEAIWPHRLCRVAIGIAGAGDRHLFSGVDSRPAEERVKALLRCGVPPACCERDEDILPIKGDTVGSVRRQILFISVSLASYLITFFF